jgi:hypothetical protein
MHWKVDKMEGGEGFICVLFKRIGKVLGQGSIVTRKGWRSIRGISGGVWFVKMIWGLGEGCMICIGKGVESGYVMVCEKENG